MLTDTQISYAKENADFVDVIPDAAGDTISYAHHTTSGVYVVVRDAASDRLYRNHCFHVSYRLLACMNNRPWPSTFAGARYALIEDQGNFWAVKKDKWSIKMPKKGVTFHPFTSLVEGPKKLRDDDGYPVKGTQWHYIVDKNIHHDYSVVRVMKDKEKVRLVHHKTQHATTMRLEYFNDNFYPTKVS